MLRQNGIRISKDKLKKIFAIIDKEKKGCLDLEQFKEFAVNDEANESRL